MDHPTLTLALTGGGGVDATPPRKVFLGRRKTAARSAAKSCIASGASFPHLLVQKNFVTSFPVTEL